MSYREYVDSGLAESQAGVDKVLQDAKDSGIETEGRSFADVERDLQQAYDDYQETIETAFSYLEERGGYDTDFMTDQQALQAYQREIGGRGLGSVDPNLVAAQFRLAAESRDLNALNELANNPVAANTVATLPDGTTVTYADIARDLASNIRDTGRRNALRKTEALEAQGIDTTEMTNADIEALYEQRVVVSYEAEVMRLTQLGVLSDDDTDAARDARMGAYFEGRERVAEWQTQQAENVYAKLLEGRRHKHRRPGSGRDIPEWRTVGHRPAAQRPPPECQLPGKRGRLH